MADLGRLTDELKGTPFRATRERLAKLPRWALELISNLTRRCVELHAALDAFQHAPGKQSVLHVWKMIGGNRVLVPCADDVAVFVLDGVRIEAHIRNGALHVMGVPEALSVVPVASNVIEVRCERG